MTRSEGFLPTELGKWNSLKSQLVDAMGEDFDDQALFDTLDGETNLVDVLQSIMRAARYKSRMAKAAKEYSKEIAEKGDRLEASAAKMRAICLNSMTDADIKKVNAPEFTMFRVRTAGKVDIPDESAVPDEWCAIKRQPKRNDIRDALRNGASFNWATLAEDGETLAVR